MSTKTVRRQTLETYGAMLLHVNARKEQYASMTPQAIRADIWSTFGPDIGNTSINKILKMAGIKVKREPVLGGKTDRVGQLASVLISVIENLDSEIVSKEEMELLVSLKQRRKV